MNRNYMIILEIMVKSNQLKLKDHEADIAKISETYIAFQHDVCAFAAVADNQNRILKKVKCEYNVQPGDSWKQPREQKSIVESMLLDEGEYEDYVPPIFMLNKDCFEKVFRYLDVD